MNKSDYLIIGMWLGLIIAVIARAIADKGVDKGWL